MPRELTGLFVDESQFERRSHDYANEIEIALREVCEVSVQWTFATRIDDAKRALLSGAHNFDLVVVDLLWEAIDDPIKIDARGLEVVRQAAKARTRVVVALSIGDATFPTLEEDALAAGADVFRLRSDLMARHGAWDRLAEDICAALHAKLQSRVPTNLSAAPETSPGKRALFVVSGRNTAIAADLSEFLRTLSLEPFSWDELVDMTIQQKRRGGNPSIFEVVEHGFEVAEGAIVLFTPDDEVRLHEEFIKPGDPDGERTFGGQARPNVLLEAGYALARNRQNTLIVSVGALRRVSDLDGLYICHLDDSEKRRKALAKRLRAMGFAVQLNGSEWLTKGKFSAAGQRTPPAQRGRGTRQ